MARRATCQAQYVRWGLRCWESATFFVYLQDEPNEGTFTCTQHLPKVCKQVAGTRATINVSVIANLLTPERSRA